MTVVVFSVTIRIIIPICMVAIIMQIRSINMCVTTIVIGINMTVSQNGLYRNGPKGATGRYAEKFMLPWPVLCLYWASSGTSSRGGGWLS